MKRRAFVALLGGAAVLPLAARAQQASRNGLDARITPARGDIAAKHLAGVVDAQRFVEGKLYQIGASQAPMRGVPSHEAELVTEALKGERITIYELSEAGSAGAGWAWGQLAGDGYVGFVAATALREPGPLPTHKVSTLRTFVYPGPSFKLPPIETLSFGCRLVVERVDGAYAITADGRHVWAGHLAPIE